MELGPKVTVRMHVLHHLTVTVNGCSPCPRGVSLDRVDQARFILCVRPV
jgi:hypothetical protein